MKVVLITEVNKDFGKKLAAIFTREKFKVYTVGEEQLNDATCLTKDLKEAAAVVQKESGCIDIFIDTSDERSPLDNFNVRTGLNGDLIHKLYDANVIRPMAMFEAFFPLLEASSEKRLCWLTSAEASINETFGTDGYGYKMAKAGLHNFLQITRNALAPKGYTIRAFEPLYNDVSPEQAAEAAFNYFTRRRGIEHDDDKRDDEYNLVFRDAYGRQHSW